MPADQNVKASDAEESMREARLRGIFSTSEFLPILKAIRHLNLPDWWVAGGAVRNTVWKRLFPEGCSLGIKDIDLAFFDAKTDRAAEAKARAALSEQFPHILFDVKNQASFGVWRDWHLRFSSTEDGIAHWLHTATAVGIRLNREDWIEIYAPYGLTDLFDGIIRPTPFSTGAKAATAKALELKSKCPTLRYPEEGPHRL